MANGEPPNDNPLLRRLHESASGDTALRQLRQRYDALRAEYEGLLGRLDEIEARIEAPPPSPPALLEQLTAPLLALRDEYAEAAAALETITGGLERLAANALKGQRGSTRGGSTDAGDAEARIQVDVRGPEVGAMLSFRDALEGMPGVRRVVLNAADSERTTFIVELG
jgi:hypothetical protein